MKNSFLFSVESKIKFSRLLNVVCAVFTFNITQKKKEKRNIVFTHLSFSTFRYVSAVDIRENRASEREEKRKKTEIKSEILKHKSTGLPSL